MKVSAIPQYGYYNNVRPCQRVNSAPAFCGGSYEKMMENVLARDLMSRADVEKAMSDLYFASVKESGITKTSVYPLLSEWLALKGTYLIEELCKPIAKVRSDMRDIIFKSYDENLAVLEKGDDKLIYIMNLGKHGFWNSVFENESAPNDIKVVFMADNGCFEVGTNKKGKLITEQSWHSGYWKKNVYNMFFGDRISHKTGDASEPVIWPAV